MHAGNTAHHATSGFSVSVDFDGLELWQVVQTTQLASPGTWHLAQHSVDATGGHATVRVRFSCVTSESRADNFCGLDTVVVAV